MIQMSPGMAKSHGQKEEAQYSFTAYLSIHMRVLTLGMVRGISDPLLSPTS